MDFETFVPIELPGQKEEDPTKRLKKRISELEAEINRLRRELQEEKFARSAEGKRFSEERKRLIEELQKAHNQIAVLQNNIQQLQLENQRLKQELELVKETFQKLELELKKNLQREKEEKLQLLLSVVSEALKILLKREQILDEETLRRIFEDIFSEKIFVGEITVKGNPEDIELLRGILEKKDKTLFDLVPDPNLHRGEIEVETEKFFVERKIDELVEELVENLFREFLKRKSPERESNNNSNGG